MQFIPVIIVLAIVQVFVLNHIHIFGVVMPLLYVYLVVLFPRGSSHWQRLLLTFGMGIAVDMFGNTPGLASASLTLAAFVQPHLLELFLKKEDEPDFRPSVTSMGFGKYMCYTFLVLTVFFIMFFALELFSFSYWAEALIGCFGSLLLTLILILTIDSVRK